jgi:hypothetical protein
MFDYFDYIHESSQEDIDDVDLIYNETDLALAEFDSYVQEGVGLKIAVGLGIAALLGTLIAVIIKVFGNRSDNKTNQAAKTALTFIERCERAGIKTITVEGTHLNLDKLSGIIMNDKYAIFYIVQSVVIFSNDCQILFALTDQEFKNEKLNEMYDELETIKKVLNDNYGKTISDVKDLFVETETIETDYVHLSINTLRGERKKILQITKKMNQYREKIKKEYNGLPEKHMKLFEEISTKISSIILELDKNIFDTFKMIIESCIKALKEKGQYRDGESLSFEHPITKEIDKIFGDDTTYVYDPKHYNSTLDEMKISDEEGD